MYCSNIVTNATTCLFGNVMVSAILREKVRPWYHKDMKHTHKSSQSPQTQ